MTNININLDAQKSILNTDSGFSCASVQMAFAELQNEMAKTSRDQAMDKINTIKRQQSVQKKISEFITELRNKTSGKKDDEEVNIGDLGNRLNAFLKEQGLPAVSVPEGKTVEIFSSKTFLGASVKVCDINKHIQSLQGIQETVGSDIQQQMLLIQELMGKVSSYTQGASSAVNKSGDVLTAILR